MPSRLQRSRQAQFSTESASGGICRTRSSRHRSSAAALGYGLAFLLAGAALLLQELELLTLRWTYVLPLILLIVGAAVLLSGFVQARRDTRGRTGPR
jgi:hypothetical protein